MDSKYSSFFFQQVRNTLPPDTGIHSKSQTTGLFTVWLLSITSLWLLSEELKELSATASGEFSKFLLTPAPCAFYDIIDFGNSFFAFLQHCGLK